jgi:predicted peptidase
MHNQTGEKRVIGEICMNRSIRLALLSMVSYCYLNGPALLRSEDAQPGKQVAQQYSYQTANNSQVTIRFWLYLPEDYKESQKFPLVLFLHGAGERGEDLEAVKKWGPPKLVAEGKHFPFILVSPQCPARQWWDVDALAKLIDHLSKSYQVDTQRIYVTGLSMGGFGTWAILAKYPQLFAAAVPICGGGDPKTAETIKDIPIWAFHGDQDNVVPLRRTQEMIEAIEKAGGKPRLTVYPGVGHNSWSPTYANEEVYQWMLAQGRPDNPSK